MLSNLEDSTLQTSNLSRRCISSAEQLRRSTVLPLYHFDDHSFF
jgi:hypothetical protein